MTLTGLRFLLALDWSLGKNGSKVGGMALAADNQSTIFLPSNLFFLHFSL